MKINLNSGVDFKIRASFLNVFEPNAIEGGTPAYNGKFIVDPKDTANIDKLETAMKAVAKEKWGEKWQKVYDGLVKTGKPKGIEVCFVKEPYSNGEGDAYDGFEDKYYVSAKNAATPLIIDRDKSPLVQSDGRPYSGCYVNIQLEIWAQDNKWGRGVRATLTGIQFYADGDAFSGGAPASADDFESLAVEEPELA